MGLGPSTAGSCEVFVGSRCTVRVGGAAKQQREAHFPRSFHAPGTPPAGTSGRAPPRAPLRGWPASMWTGRSGEEAPSLAAPRAPTCFARQPFLFTSFMRACKQAALPAASTSLPARSAGSVSRLPISRRPGIPAWTCLGSPGSRRGGGGGGRMLARGQERMGDGGGGGADVRGF